MGIMPIGCIRDKEGIDDVMAMFIECEKIEDFVLFFAIEAQISLEF
jgi:hypothetical protein